MSASDVDAFLSFRGDMDVRWDKPRVEPTPAPPSVAGCSWDGVHPGPDEDDVSWAEFDSAIPVDTRRKVIPSNKKLTKEQRQKLKDEQQLAEARESIRKRGWSEGEVKWRSWLATRGHDVQVNDWNLHKYVEGECIPPSRDPWFLNANDKEMPDYEAGNDGVENEDPEPEVTDILSQPIRPAWRYPPPKPLRPLWGDVDEAMLLLQGLGRRSDTYYWRQTTSTVQLEVKLPEGTSARELRVSMQPTRLTVQIGAEPPLFDEELFMKIYVGSNTDEDCSIWEVQDKRVIVFHLVKWHRLKAGNARDASKTWWCKCMKDESAFDLKVPHAEYYNQKEK